MRPHHYAQVVAALLAAEAVFAVVHRIVGASYPGFAPLHNVVIDLGLTTIWTAGAVAALVQRSSATFVVAMSAVFASLVHGLMFSIAERAPVGLPFLVATVVLTVALKRAAAGWMIEQPAAAVLRPATA